MRKDLIFAIDRKKLDFFELHPALIKIMGIMNYDFSLNGYDFVVTSSIRSEPEEKALKAKSRTHKDGRAVDVSIKGIDEDWLKSYIKEIEEDYGHLGAISSKTGNNKLIVLHNSGHGMHFHVQVRN